MKKAVIYIHGKGGNADEAERYKPLFKDYDVIGFDYHACTPWEARTEFPQFMDLISQKYESVILIANSIGAYFAMHTLSGKCIDKTFLISPVVDMEKLILNMMLWSDVTEEELKDKEVISTTFGETLSWKYLCYVREHPIEWKSPSEILYGENDTMTSYETISDFANRIHAKLTVMKNGEHWFHTEEQMQFLDNWIRKSIAEEI